MKVSTLFLFPTLYIRYTFEANVFILTNILIKYTYQNKYRFITRRFLFEYESQNIQRVNFNLDTHNSITSTTEYNEDIITFM